MPCASSHFELVTLELNCLNKGCKSGFVIGELGALQKRSAGRSLRAQPLPALPRWSGRSRGAEQSSSDSPAALSGEQR